MRTVINLAELAKGRGVSRQFLQRQVQRLAGEQTDTDSAQITEFQATRWEEEVRKFGEDMRRLQQIVDVNTILLGSRDKTVTIPVTTSHLDIDTSSKTEGSERYYTEMSNLDTVDITPTFKLGAIKITKEIVDTSRVDLIALAKYMIAQDMEQDIEASINTALTGISNNKVWGGDATATNSVETGDIITPDLIMDAKAAIEAKNFEAKWICVHPNQINKALLKDSQFVNASEYGGTTPLLKGEIGEFSGMKLIKTTNITGSTSWGGSENVTGHYFYVLGAMPGGRTGVTLAWKQKTTLDYEYLKKFTSHYIYYDACYASKIVQDKSLCIGHVADS